MTFQTKLDVVNTCLGTMGELPLSSLDATHPYVDVILNILDRYNVSIQARGWWFNRMRCTLTADVTGKISLPDNTTGWVINSPASRPLAPQGSHLVDMTTGSNLFDVGESFTASYRKILPFESIPAEVNRLVAVTAVMHFQDDYVAESAKRQSLAQEVQDAMAAAVKEDARVSKYNMSLNGQAGMNRLRRKNPGNYWSCR